MPHIHICEGHFAFHGDLVILKLCLLLSGRGGNHYVFLLPAAKCEQGFSVGKRCLCCH